MKTRQKTLDEYKALLTGSGKAYEALETLFDAGTFVELGRLVKRVTTDADTKDGSEFEGVITGYGAVEGRLVFAYAQDEGRMKGAMSEAQAKKIVSLIEAAMKTGAPVVGILGSAGAKVEEGVAALSGYGSIMKAVAAASGVIPQITVIAGICSGCMATVASMTDIVIGAEDSGKLYINPPFVLAAKGAKKAGSLEVAAKNGSVNLLAKDCAEAVAKAKALLCLLPSNNAEGSAYTETADAPEREVAATGALPEVAAELADAGSFILLSEKNAPETLTGIGSMGGLTVGFVGAENTVTPYGARKAANFISFCDSFRIPVLTLVNCTGTDCSEEAENVPFSAKLAQLAAIYAASTTAKVTVILGKAFGSAFTLLGSKALGADIVYAVEDAEISILPTDAAVEFLYSEEIKAAKDPAAKRAELTEEWKAGEASALNAARNGDIDDLVERSELRARIASAFEMLSSKATAEPYKKHGNMPL